MLKPHDVEPPAVELESVPAVKPSRKHLVKRKARGGLLDIIGL